MGHLKGAIEDAFGPILRVCAAYKDRLSPDLRDIRFDFQPSAKLRYKKRLIINLRDLGQMEIDVTCATTPWCSVCRRHFHKDTDDCCPAKKKKSSSQEKEAVKQGDGNEGDREEGKGKGKGKSKDGKGDKVEGDEGEEGKGKEGNGEREKEKGRKKGKEVTPEKDDGNGKGEKGRQKWKDKEGEDNGKKGGEEESKEAKEREKVKEPSPISKNELRVEKQTEKQIDGSGTRKEKLKGIETGAEGGNRGKGGVEVG
ncbi:hypothetical protein CBR_g12443 [Chara braunii]|uniref:Uncharacterized protein n=1 Tax=Chara braunii TaxID=69332 RepID=A0A388JSC8_CHABU|nr:hypothetical protein CBR_g12443 [Chara braunii]|eukprot:GBG60706.1 hypothetical protein CBR_g12443 [Chara braunii]